MKTHLDPQPVLRWKKLFVKGGLWLSAEVVLGLVGLDNLADYSEFLAQSRLPTELVELASSWVNWL